MTPEKIISVVEMYEDRLRLVGAQKQRMSTDRTFGSLSRDELLAHAYFLCEGTKKYAANPEKQRKAGSHLTAIQMCLRFANWYTLEDIMSHNRS